MENNKKNTPSNTITRSLADVDALTGNIYDSVNIIARRANEISGITKAELQKKLQEFAGASDNLEETFENREQIEISRFYERMPKATLVATEEFLCGELKTVKTKK